MLVESGSQIKYSPSPFFRPGGQWHRWHIIQEPTCGLQPILMAIRTCSSLNAMRTAYGSTTIGRIRTTTGIPTMSSSSLCESIFFPAFIMSGFSFPGSRGFSSNRQAFCRFLAVSRRYLRIVCLRLIFPPK